jgi:hypothetical protein
VSEWRVQAQVDIREYIPWRDEEDTFVPRRFTVYASHPDVGAELVLRVAVEHGRLVCNELHAVRKPDGSPITTDRTLRAIPIRELLVTGARGLMWSGEEVGPGVFDAGFPGEPSRRADRLARQLGSNRKPVNRESLLRAAAEIYRAATASGDPQPSKAVAAELGYSDGYARNLVKEARDEGHLEPAPGPRRAGEKKQRRRTKK